MDFHLKHVSSGSDIRLCIFFITSVCVGLPALVWAFRLLHLHRKIRGQISSFIVLLLLSDLIQLLLNIYIVTQLLTKSYWYLSIVFQFWSGLHWCGFHLHQLVTLEGVLTLKYPLWSARIFSLPCYIIISILVLVFSIVSALTSHNPIFAPSLFSFASILASLIYLVITIAITCKASSTPVSKNTCSVFTVAILTFVMLYLPFMLIMSVNFFTCGVGMSWFEVSLCLMSLRVISDPILCVLVCRGNLRDVQTPQTHTEPNSDQTSALT